MRIWSLHPSLLDRQGLTALWRETLLAQAVVAGRTRGYTRHPQLLRFTATGDARGYLAAYLDGVREEATRRGYRYDPGRIDDVERAQGLVDVTDGQVAFELAHLRAKLERRSPDLVSALPTGDAPVHPLFRVVPGPIADWERP